jgi:ribonuclease VapC
VIVDASALLAVVLDEPDGRRFAEMTAGDCIVNGVAKAECEPLLFKGDDFSRTDIEPALKD